MTPASVGGTAGSVDPFATRTLLDTLSARDSAPAAGSAAAIVAATAAAIVVKAARRAGDAGAAAQASALVERLSTLAALDADVFATALAALRRATERDDAGEDGSASRDFELRRTLEEAASVPLAIAEAAADVALLAAEVARGAPESELTEDATAAAMLAGGAARAAAHLVSINLASRPTDVTIARAAAAAATGELR